jgi:hypothetical protein
VIWVAYHSRQMQLVAVSMADQPQAVPALEVGRLPAPLLMAQGCS